MVPVVPCLRPGALPCPVGAPLLDLIERLAQGPPGNTLGKAISFRYAARVTNKHMERFQRLAPDACPIPSGNPLAQFPTGWPGDHATPPIGGGFSTIVPAPPGCADEVRSRPFTVMDALGIEHGRENALMPLRGSTERTDRYTQGIR